MIEVRDLSLKLGSFEIRDLKLEVSEGEYLVVMGPSGSGKTVLLQSLLGIIKPLRGRVFVDGRDVTDAPPESRGLSYVPQDYALFPHMSVFDNIAYGLRVRGLSKREVTERVKEIAGIMEISNLLNRKPVTLSGGEKQRVALARGLVVNPKGLLLDEPLSALHRGMREDLQAFLKKLHGELGFTAIHVTHDHVEAAYLGDRIAVMIDGKILGIGKLEELLRNPADERVAEVLCCENLLRGYAIKKGELTSVRIGEIELKSAYPAEGEVLVLIRPEEVYIHQSAEVGKISARNLLIAVVEAVEFTPPVYTLSLNVRGVLLKSIVTKQALEDLGIDRGKEFAVSMKASAVRLIPSQQFR